MLSSRIAVAGLVTLAWDPSSPDVAGYRLYYGTTSRLSSGTYSDSIDVGNSTSRTVSDLIFGNTYFFAVTAYNEAGLESDFSEEIVYTPRLQISGLVADEGGLTLTWPGAVGTLFRVLATHSLVSPVWVDVSGPVLAVSPTTSWTHVRTSSEPQVFYRLEIIGSGLSSGSSASR